MASRLTSKTVRRWLSVPLTESSFMTWATGPKASRNLSARNDEPGVPIDPAENQTVSAEPTVSHVPSAENTAGDVPAYGTGLGADTLQGTLESTAIFEIIRDNL